VAQGIDTTDKVKLVNATGAALEITNDATHLALSTRDREVVRLLARITEQLDEISALLHAAVNQ
jgi:hypothetical protein